MGGIGPAAIARSGRKPIDAAINLVPFIDLLSCCISFLLITAVWSQIAQIEVRQEGGQPKLAAHRPESLGMQLSLSIARDGFLFATSTGEMMQIPLAGGDFDYAKLREVLVRARAIFPSDRKDIVIKSNDGVLYLKIIKTIDLAISTGFTEVSFGDER